MRLEGLGKLEKISLIGTRTPELTVRSRVPQPNTLTPNDFKTIVGYFPTQQPDSIK
jgi:hypothetical protein